MRSARLAVRQTASDVSRGPIIRQSPRRPIGMSSVCRFGRSRARDAAGGRRQHPRSAQTPAAGAADPGPPLAARKTSQRELAFAKLKALAEGAAIVAVRFAGA